MDENEKHFLTLQMLENIYMRCRKLEEKMDCILHAVCKGDDSETNQAIKKYLLSKFRNTQGM